MPWINYIDGGFEMTIAIQILDFIISISLTLYLFSKVNQRKLSLIEILYALLVNVPLAAFFATLISFTGQDFFSYFSFPIYFIILSFLFLRPLSNTLLIFYGLFPVTLWNLFYRSMNFFILPLLNLDRLMQESFLWSNITDLIAIFLALSFIKWLQYDFVQLRSRDIDSRDKKILYLTNWLMGAYYVVIQILTYLEFERQIDTLPYRELVVFIYFILFMGVVNRLDRYLRDRLQATLNFRQKLQLEGMEKYSRHIEELYMEVRGFRHDYSNLLTTLKWGIEEENLPQIKEVYESVLKDSNKQLRNNKYDVGRLVNEKNSALKSILAAKFIEASEQNISVSLEIPNEIDPKGMELVDFITIVSIFCDNAIEASREAENPAIRMAYLHTGEKQLFVIENAIPQESVAISNIFDFETSSKGENRGMGLYNVMEILKRYPNASLKTTSQHHTFTQLLEIQQ